MLRQPDSYNNLETSKSITSERVPLGSCQVIFNPLSSIFWQNFNNQGLFITKVKS